MTTYAVHCRSDGAEIYRYTADAPVEWQGCEFAITTHDVVPDPAAAPAPPPTAQQWRPVDFLRRFTALERIAARHLRETDPVLDDFFALLEASDLLHSDDRDMRMGMGYLVRLGVLTTARRDTILGDTP